MGDSNVLPSYEWCKSGHVSTGHIRGSSSLDQLEILDGYLSDLPRLNYQCPHGINSGSSFLSQRGVSLDYQFPIDITGLETYVQQLGVGRIINFLTHRHNRVVL